MEDGHLGHGQDDRAVGQRLREQQAKVGFVVHGPEGFIDARRHDGVDTGEGGVQYDHHDTIAGLGPVALMI